MKPDIGGEAKRGGEGISGRAPGVAARQDLHADSGTARLHTEGEWEIASARDSDGARPSGADGGSVDPGADLRSRFRGLLLWVPSGPVGPSGAGGDTRACEGRVSSGV